MSLSRATFPDGRPVSLEGEPPYAAAALEPLFEVPFLLPCEDRAVLGAGAPANAYLEAARTAWEEWPEWMDFLDPESPAYPLKRAARDLYLHWWRPWLSGRRVLDVGCGIGRFVLPLLDRGATVWGVDGDLHSLQRCAWRAAGRPGRLDLHWSAIHRLPPVFDLDVVIACEVLCYVPDTKPVLHEIVERLRPGGALLVSLEARYGWASSADAAPTALSPIVGTERVVDIPGDRWVRTYDRAELRAELEDAGLQVERLVATHYVPEGPLEQSAPEDMDLAQLLEVEQACRAHPVWGPLNRVWTAVAIKPR
ncbi:MAG: class I SAM-dependent methyltransferase [Deltaproteobacteria bacterium]|nr:class I SAM-dependent methyltransferase [Deltaproteobacteria bacterium]